MSRDLFEGFDTRRIAGSGADIFCRIGGSGPPLVLVHGYPQTHVEWHRIAPALAERFTLVMPDLRGYGASSIPANDATNAPYSKRAMAADVVAVMRALGFARFAVAGHDRGGRVAYRLALDAPERVTRLAVLDIVPTHEMWTTVDAARAMKVYHWMFLAQPKPLPEMLIGANPRAFIDHTLASWTKARDLSAFAPDALAAYRAFFAEPARLSATCDDYRAGQTIDLALDSADIAAGRKITAPVLALWGAAGIPAEGAAGGEPWPLQVWRRWAQEVSGEALDAGHFLPEEAPEATAAALSRFF